MAGWGRFAWAGATLRTAGVGGGWGLDGAEESQQSCLPQSQQRHAADSTCTTGETEATACVHINRPASRMAMAARTAEYYALRAGTQWVSWLTTSSRR